MARYAAIQDLIDRDSINDLAERAAPENNAVTGDLLGKKLAGSSLSGETVGTQAALTLAVDRLNQALDDASADIDGYISRMLPLADPPPAMIKGRCVDIALFRLFGGERGSPREALYQSALAWLRRVGNGEIALTNDDGDDQDGNDVLISAGTKVFDEATLDDFTR